MDMRTCLEIQEMKVRLLNRSGGRCVECGEPVSLCTCQLAHRIPKTKYNLKTYGKSVIHHELNLAVVCSLRCNSAVLLNIATHPIEAAQLIDRIREDLKEKNQ